MRLLVITDLHDYPARLEQILAQAGPVEAVLLGGDLTTFGTPADAEQIIRAAQAQVSTVWAVAGNCDSPEIDRHLASLGVSLAGRGITLGPLGLQGLSAIPPWRSGMYCQSEEELAASLEAGYAQLGTPPLHGVLAHVPPYGLRADRTFLWRHAGSTALRAFVERTQPAVVFCGHIHEGRGIEQWGKTQVVNCGEAAAGHYALAEIDETVSVELHRV